MAKVLLAKHNDMVKAIPPDRSDKPLRTSVLPRRSWRDRPIPYAHCSETAKKDIAVHAIPVANNISRRLLPPVCLGQLPGNPFGARVSGDTQPQELTTAVLQNQESVQQPKRSLCSSSAGQSGAILIATANRAGSPCDATGPPLPVSPAPSRARPAARPDIANTHRSRSAQRRCRRRTAT
jgi:hypothetical protein